MRGVPAARVGSASRADHVSGRDYRRVPLVAAGAVAVMSDPDLDRIDFARKRPRETPIVVWRVGRSVPLNVYEGDRPVCQCHSAEDAARIVAAVNFARAEGK